jgi:transcriptional regulator with XRE-family HTH domain
MAATEPSSGGTSWELADKINHLFATIRRPDGKQYSNEEVAAAISRTAVDDGPKISGAYLWYLRNGQRDNPTKKHLEALAAFFQVSPAYFFDDERSREIVNELAVLRILADSNVQRVAMRLGGLSKASLRAVAEVVDRVRQLEGLSDPSQDLRSIDGPSTVENGE